MATDAPQDSHAAPLQDAGPSVPVHGGDLAAAVLRHGRPHAQWMDLSTGLNPHPYPVPPLADDTWHRLPEPSAALRAAAIACYGAPDMLPVAGTQAAIQNLPLSRMRSHGKANVAVSAPSYAEHAFCWAQAGHRVRPTAYAALAAAAADVAVDVLVVCNPNNPTGASVSPETLLAWHAALAARGGWLVVDEAFGETAPALSIAGASARPGLIVLRSLGKFFGLAGVRLGFVGAEPALLAALSAQIGPWSVSSAAQQIGCAALNDTGWQHATRTLLAREGSRLRQLLQRHGMDSAGTDLYQWWALPPERAQACHAHLAQAGIWARLFVDAAAGIRLGLPADEQGWQRLEAALAAWPHGAEATCATA